MLGGIIFQFHTIIFGNETRTTFIEFADLDRNLKIGDDSSITIQYIPEGNELITFHLKLDNLNERQNGSLNIHYNGEMEKVSKLYSNNGVEEDVTYTIDGSTYRNYKLNFDDSNRLNLDETFSSNIITDKGGDVRLDLSLHQYPQFGNIDKINVFIMGLSELKIEYLYPPTNVPYLNYIQYNYTIKDGETISIKGYNPNIGNSRKETEFGIGVLIAILTSSIVAFGVEILKDTSQFKKN